jgi:hypothetical protein
LEKKVTEPKAHAVRYHEAGHAVVARLLGIPVSEVTARPARGGKFRGLTVVAIDGRQQSDLARHEGRIKVLLAGSLTEAKKFPESNWEEIQGNCFSDWTTLYRHAEEIRKILGQPKPKRDNIFHMHPGNEKLIRALAEQTETLIAANWPAITRVAKALHRKASLNQHEVDALIAAAK